MVCLVGISYGQDDILDFSNLAFQMSNTFPGGSARINGLAGAQTALGGDISSASSNPAGLGFFNRSEFTFTPNFNYVYSQGDYLDQTTDDAKLNFNFSNLGVVLNNSKSDIVDSKWRGGSFGISINRVADFQNSITYEADNRISDFIDFAVNSDNGFNANGQNDLSDLAFNTFLTDQFYTIYQGQDSISINGLLYDVNDLYGNNLSNGDSLFFVDRNIYRPDGSLAFPTQDEPTRQRETINSKGATYQASFAYGGNYADKFYFGASIGVLSYSHQVKRTYTEQPFNADLSELILEDNFDQTGVGVNASLGVIVRPVAPLLLGLNYTTPSYYAIEQQRSLDLTAIYPGFDTEYDGIDYEPFQYSITTPARLKAGATYFFGKNGFITGDVENVRYQGARLSNADGGYSFSNENQSLKNYSSVLNYRVGAEYRFDKFRVRAGYAYLSDPKDDNLDQSVTQISFGGGFRTRKFYGDVGIINRLGSENSISPYPNAQLAKITTNKTSMAITIGWFF